MEFIRITSFVVSIKNPLAGHIYVPSVGELIYDDKLARGILETQNCSHASCV